MCELRLACLAIGNARDIGDAHGGGTIHEDDDPVLLDALGLVLGANLFRSFPFVQFDLPRKRILLATSQDYQPDESRLLATLPLQEEKGALACVVLGPKFQSK